jgi:hypothetical protein
MLARGSGEGGVWWRLAKEACHGITWPSLQPSRRDAVAVVESARLAPKPPPSSFLAPLARAFPGALAPLLGGSRSHVRGVRWPVRRLGAGLERYAGTALRLAMESRTRAD